MKHTIEIAGRKIGPEYPTFVIAEMSGNHNMDYSRAVEIIKAAKYAGADAIKLQTYTADTITLNSKKECFKTAGVDGGQWKCGCCDSETMSVCRVFFHCSLSHRSMQHHPSIQEPDHKTEICT